ncbi:MAG TPA: ArsB/NhaD family transporter [Clostridia bacterium]|nr:ArsB/NhaD family transporter [Clostridia bacterium]
MIVSVVIFVVTYALIIWDKFDRAVIALSGGALMIFFNFLSQKEAFAEVDFNTIGLLVGMMIIVMITKRSGIFEYLAVKLVKVAKAEPFKIIILLSITTGLLSALLDNVTTILLILPVTLSIAKDLKLNPIPFIIAEVFSSNIGGAATLVGDPPNILIGSAAGLSFMDFIKNAAVIVLPMLFLTTFIFSIMYRKKLKSSDEVKKAVLALDENSYLKDKALLIKSVIVIFVVIIGFLLHGVLHYESATIAMSGAALLLLISGMRPEKIFHEVEWKTIFFFIGLFILVGGIKATGVIDLLAGKTLDLTGGNVVLASLSILWLSAIASAFVDNIPFVTTMIPLIQKLGTLSNMNITPLWWALSLGACLGGNGTIIGASANVIAVGIAEEHGCKITFGHFFKKAFPMMILTIAISTIYLLLFFLL